MSVVFVVLLCWRWQGRILGVIITSVIFGLLSIFVIYKREYIKFSFNKKYIKDVLFFGIPLIPHALGGWIITGVDIIFINSMVGVAATGIYTVGYQVGMIIGMQIELSLAHLYEGQSLYHNMLDYIINLGFELYDILPVFSDKKSGRLLQFDGIFFRSL